MSEISVDAMFDDFESASLGGGSVYMDDGDYILEVTEVKNGKAEQQGWPFFVVEYKVLASTNAHHRPGMSISWMVAFKKEQYKKTYQGDVKQFLLAAWQSKDPSVTVENMDKAVWAASAAVGQPLVGALVRGQAHTRKNKYSDGNFTAVKYFPLTKGEAQDCVQAIIKDAEDAAA